MRAQTATDGDHLIGLAYGCLSSLSLFSQWIGSSLCCLSSDMTAFVWCKPVAHNSRFWVVIFLLACNLSGFKPLYVINSNQMMTLQL